MKFTIKKEEHALAGAIVKKKAPLHRVSLGTLSFFSLVLLNKFYPADGFSGCLFFGRGLVFDYVSVMPDRTFQQLRHIMSDLGIHNIGICTRGPVGRSDDHN
jgi:hypothetical protein